MTGQTGPEPVVPDPREWPAAQDPPAAPGATPARGAAPIDPSERNATLDILRGFAMLGILLVNMELFRGALWPAMVGSLPDPSPADRVVETATAWFAQGKFISSFAFMFGLGTAVQLARSRARGVVGVGRLPRRFAVLLVIGLLHGFLIWSGDVLALYAVCGFVLLAFAKVSVRVTLWWAAGVAVGLAVLAGIGVAVLVALSAAFGDMGAADAEAGMAFLEPIADRAVEVYANGGYLDQVRFRLWEFPFAQFGTAFYAPLVFVLMLLGLAAGKAGMVTDTERFTALLRRVRGWGLGLGLPLNGVMAFGLASVGGQAGMMAAAPEDMTALGALAMPLSFVAPPILALGYLATITLACRDAALRDRLSPLAAVGRMAISAYLFQSIVCTAFFSVTGLYASASASFGLVVVVAVWAASLVLCPLWLRSFRMGPVEWLWRWLTYGSRPPLRVAEAGAR